MSRIRTEALDEAVRRIYWIDFPSVLDHGMRGVRCETCNAIFHEIRDEYRRIIAADHDLTDHTGFRTTTPARR